MYFAYLRSKNCLINSADDNGTGPNFQKIKLEVPRSTSVVINLCTDLSLARS